ncbi:hypothetical protein [Clostridium perfringens]
MPKICKDKTNVECVQCEYSKRIEYTKQNGRASFNYKCTKYNVITFKKL